MICLTFFLTCKKGIQQDNLYIRGRLFLLDTITGVYNGTPLAKRKVVLAEKAADSINYILSDTTDANGYFVFTLLSDWKKDHFIVRFDDTIRSYFYSGAADATAGTDTVRVIARIDSLKQNGFIITMVDESGSPLPAVNVRLFGNSDLAALDKPTGAVASLTSDAYGLVYRFNLPVADYYLNADKTVDTATYRRLLKHIPLKDYHIFRDTMVLQHKIVHQNGMEFVVTDTDGGAIPRAIVSLYSSQTLALLKDTSNAVLNALSDNSGKVRWYDLTAGAYYVNAIKKVDTVTLSLLASPVSLPVDKIIRDTLKVIKQ